MIEYNILEARNNLSRLIASVESGIEVTITRRGKPVARLVPASSASPKSWGDWFDEEHRVGDDFLADRDQGVAEDRRSW